MQSTPRASWSVIGLIVFFFSLTVLTFIGFFSRPWLPPIASRHGGDVDRLIHFLLVTAGIVFVAGHVVLGGIIWKCRRRQDETTSASRPIPAWVWIVAPTLLFVLVVTGGILGLSLKMSQHLSGEVPPNAVVVEVIGKQFEWLIHYPGKDGVFGKTEIERIHEIINPLGLDKQDPHARDDLFVRGVLRLPVGRPVSIQLRSHDVQHAFAVPAFRVLQQIIPGMVTHVQFEPTAVGQYELACMEMCGLGHFQMRGMVLVVSQQEFDQWLSEQKGWFE